jgi:hypothetical protein
MRHYVVTVPRQAQNSILQVRWFWTERGALGWRNLIRDQGARAYIVSRDRWYEIGLTV